MKQMIDGQLKVSCDRCGATSGTITLTVSEDMCDTCEATKKEREEKKAKQRARRELLCLRIRAEHDLDELIETRWFVPWNMKKFRKDLKQALDNVRMFSEEEAQL